MKKKICTYWFLFWKYKDNPFLLFSMHRISKMNQVLLASGKIIILWRLLDCNGVRWREVEKESNIRLYVNAKMVGRLYNQQIKLYRWVGKQMFLTFGGKFHFFASTSEVLRVIGSLNENSITEAKFLPVANWNHQNKLLDKIQSNREKVLVNASIRLGKKCWKKSASITARYGLKKSKIFCHFCLVSTIKNSKTYTINYFDLFSSAFFFFCKILIIFKSFQN